MILLSSQLGKCSCLAESCIFSQLLNLGALLVGIVVYIRYKQVHEFLLSHEIGQRSIRVNAVGLYLGWIGAFGISIVANFQETAVFRVHLVGALMAFGIGSLYLWTQVKEEDYIVAQRILFWVQLRSLINQVVNQSFNFKLIPTLP